MGPVNLAANAENAEVGESLFVRKLIMVEQFVVGLFLDRGLDAVRGAQSLE